LLLKKLRGLSPRANYTDWVTAACRRKLKKCKSPGIDQILYKMIQAEDETFLSAIHKLINSILNKEELSDQWKESIIVTIHKKGDKTDYNNYCGISLLSTSYKMLSNIKFIYRWI
jgi:hypothetical protein